MDDQAQASAPSAPVDRMAEIEAERRKIAEAREARGETEAAARKLAQAEQALLDDKAIAEAEERHESRSFLFGEEKCTDHKLAVVRTAQGVIIVKRPHSPTYHRFVDEGKGSPNHEHCMKLVQPIVVYPKDRYQKMFDAQPGLLIVCANAAVELAIGSAGAVAGK